MVMKKERILVVDDEKSSRETICKMMSQIGYEAVAAAHGNEALEWLRRDPFTLLVTDITMSGMDGLELSKIVRLEFPGTPILCMTDDAAKDLDADFLASGMTDYITKPFILGEVKAKLTRIIRDRDRMEELVQKSVELQVTNEELRRLDQLKASFVSSVSDEAQTPMTVIKEFVSLMLKGQVGSLTDEQKEYLGVANRNILRLSSLVDKLLDFSRIEAGKALKLRFRPTRLIEVIEDAQMALSQQLGEKRIALENRIDAETPLVMADRNRLIEVIINLLGNGIKFTPPDGKITIDSKGLSEDRDYLKMVVSDTGVGISPEDLPKIFDRFYQGQRTAEESTKGTGLGLSITKEIVEGHKGTLYAESRDGSGASFFFSLPLFGVNSIFNLMILPMLDEAERDSLPLSMIQVGFWNQKTQRESVFSPEDWEEVVNAIQKMVRSIDAVVPFRGNKIYILTFNDKKLAKEIGKRVQGKLVYGNYVPKKTEVQCITYSYPQEAPGREDFLKGCRALLKED
jgi:signal transduction histidine kinase